jgi:hypothetical protein
MQQRVQESPERTESKITVTPSRRQLDNRFPSLCFFVETGGDHPFFELLVTTDRGLFEPARAAERNAGNFYSSREDVGLLDAQDGRGAFHVPPAVIRNFAQQKPRPGRLYFVAIAYATAQGSRPIFSHTPQALPNIAPFIGLAGNFTGASLSQVLGTSAERLKTVGGRRPGPGGLPLQPGSQSEAARSDRSDTSTDQPAAGQVPESSRPAHPQPDPEDGDRRQDAGQPIRQPLVPPNEPSGHRGNGAAPPPDIASAREEPDDLPDLEYDDGFGDANADAPETTTPRPGPVNGYGDEDYDDSPPARAKPPIEPESDSGDRNRRDDRGSGKTNGSTPPEAHSPSSNPLPEVDPLEGVVAQSLEQASTNEAAKTPQTRPRHDSPQASSWNPDAAEKRQLIEWVASLESGNPRYAAINPDGEFKGRFGRDNPYYQRAHAGLSYGIVPFTQDSGTLGQLLTAMHQRDSAYFETVFGPDWQELLEVTNASGPGSLESEDGRSARVQPVAGQDLWENEWLERFRLAAAHPPFQAAQNQLAAELFLEPALELARDLGMASQRGVAILYDRCAQMGTDRARDYVLEQLSPIKSEAQRSAALASLLESQEEASLSAFQRTVGLPADGSWNAVTHMRLLGALRERHQQGREIPLVIPGYEEMLDTLAAVARGRPWEERLKQLRAHPELSDAPYET